MPWSNNNGGGGWQGGGGGNRGPWGQGPSGGGNQPPDIDELIRRGQEKLRQMVPGGTGGGRGIVLIIVAIAIVFFTWSSVYRVDTDQQGIVLRFGKVVRAEDPGLHVKLPFPIETVQLPTVTRINRIDIGMRDTGGSSSVNVAEEGLMLTGDENIVDISFTVRWRIKYDPDAQGATDYLFNVEEPERTVRAIAESAMREVVGQSNIQALLTTGRTDVQNKVKGLMQQALDYYKAGIDITEVQLQNSNPPSAVIDAFRDVQAAQADQERLRFEANTYANTVVPKARGQAAQITQGAEAYREQIVAEAQGEAKRFISIYNEYKKAKDVTRQRLYLETMEDVYARINKVLLDPGEGGKGVLPYLPLSGLKAGPPAGSSDAVSGSTSATSSESRP
ncbi:MAG: FtsH protease activity modulator HflK [Parvibaculum sp.]|uniref:FtsH protease activity modulator HflK n=1 Tax=Parvibaculum sp. TaxID=2024848 RepID=UPI0025E8E5A6|nr:FtsH protease activity modulator HflK [Parvibaculum sp.]MCE9650816.1 FtsH protease activity modulator HflK [Parvibaculum sp.]